MQRLAILMAIGACAILTTAAHAQVPGGIHSPIPFEDFGNPYEYESIRFVNVNGGPQDEMCYLAPEGVRCRTLRFTATGLQFQDDRLWSAAFGFYAIPGGSSPRVVAFPDITGDGRADICALTAYGVKCAVSNGQQFVNARYWNTDFNFMFGSLNDPAFTKTLAFPDVDGNGSADVCVRGASGVWCAYSNSFDTFSVATPAAPFFSDANGWRATPRYSSIMYANIDGHGGDDICGRAADGIYCGRSLGGGFETPWRWHANFRDSYGWDQPQYAGSVTLGDVTGDGRADLCGRGGAGYYCARSYGTGFANLVLVASAFSDGNGWASAPRYYDTVGLVDITGDGKLDVCGRGYAGVWCAVATASYGYVSFGTTRLHVAAFGDAYEAGLAGPNLGALGFGEWERYWGTLQPADVDLDGADELCARTPLGLECTL